MSKIVTVLGGTGYVGKRIIQEVLIRGGSTIKVFSVSRRGTDPSNKSIDSRLEYIKGDCLSPSTFEDVIKSSNSIVHSVGVLITNKKSEENGSYNMVNKESCLRVANLANSFASSSNKKNVIYVSASRGLPFPLNIYFGGYFKTKLECEEELRKLNNINAIIIKPGFVKDAKDRWWSVPLGVGTDLLSVIDQNVVKKLNPNASDYLSLPTKSIQLEIVARYCAEGALGHLELRDYLNDEMLAKPLI